METREYFEKVMQDYNQNRNGRSLCKYSFVPSVESGKDERFVHLLFKKKRTKENSCVPMVASGKAERYIPQTPCYIAPGLN